MICSDSQLSDLDIQLAQSYRRSRALSDHPKFVLSEQKAWLENIRNKCQDSACLTQAYTSRINRLDNVANAALASQPNENSNSLGHEKVSTSWEYAYVDMEKVCNSFYSLYPRTVKCIKDRLYGVRYKVIYDYRGMRREVYLTYIPGKKSSVDENGNLILRDEAVRGSY